MSGTIYVNIINQKLKDFILITPFAKITCKKCEFWIISNKNIGDIHHTISGKGTIITQNNSMEFSIDSTITINTNLEIDKVPTTIEYKKNLELLNLHANEFLNQKSTSQYKISTEDSEEIYYEVIIKLINPINIERELIITYTK